MASLHFALSTTTEIVIVGDPQADDSRKMLSIIGKTFSPMTVSLFKDSTADTKTLTELAPYTADYTSQDGKTTAYVCRNYSCESPTCDPKDLKKFLQS